MIGSSPNWICCQLGAREHYAIPEALHSLGYLDLLVTDTWVPPSSPFSLLRGSVSQRFNPTISPSRVKSFTSAALRFELIARFLRRGGWNLTISRNKWFQARTTHQLNSLFANDSSRNRILFSYSYTALELFKWARKRGWRTVLGQIDGGIQDHVLISETFAGLQNQHSLATPPPSTYWDHWKEECRLADRIVVNSNWSRELVAKAGIPKDKICSIPLAYSPTIRTSPFQRSYPKTFSRSRPLRVLFLGQVSARKGIQLTLQAARILQELPVQFNVVGPILYPRTLEEQTLPNVQWIGSVPRDRVAEWYKISDVFLFPTYSDGFGLTQLEALSWQLPIVASRRCGEVVDQGINGLLLDELTGQHIADNLIRFLQQPTLLQQLAYNCKISDSYSHSAVGRSLVSLFSTNSVDL